MRRPVRKQGAQNILGAVLIGAVMLALGAFAYAGLALRPPPTDAETLCRTDAPLGAHTIIFIDTSDRMEARHRRKLQAVADQERARLGQYDRLTIMRLNARNPQEPAILFSKCLPLPPDQANPFVQNPREVRARWEEDFAAALERALRSAQSSGPTRASPLLAGVRAIAADPDFGADIAQRRLVIMSDMLEHEPDGFTLYADDADYMRWRAVSAVAPADLSRVAVRIVPIDRPDHAAEQNRALAGFWPDYFDAALAASVSIDPAP
ncbi:MAG: hypothetical protein NW206_01095 [Hyphomonadaceae bacterium]|nr:hypothetical protein [Hyphomonadaceae bacterium]